MSNQKSIADLFKESVEQGLDPYEHVAKEIWGTVNVTTRRLAKEVCYGIMYGQGEARRARSVTDSELTKLRDMGHRWRLTEEEIEEKLKQPIEIKSEYMCEPPNIQHVVPKSAAELLGDHNMLEGREFRPNVPSWHSGDPQQSEDRIHRKGVATYVVEVFDDSGSESRKYTVHAASALDARCMAFILDGGCEAGLKHWDDGHIELAITYTVIL